MIRKKIFWKNGSGKRDIVINDCPENVEYYSYLKKQADAGCKQITFLFSMMIGIIEICANNQTWNLFDIEMMERDDDFKQELDFYLSHLSINRGYYYELIKLLTNYCEESAAEIKVIRFTNKISDSKFEEGYVQINGIIGVSENQTCIENEIRRYVEEIMN